jgi:two-component system chemotaxis response regulator CheY
VSLRVLTVDDSKTMRDMVAFTLRQAGYTVSEAEDGQKALTALRGFSADLVITDLNMPNMDGIALIRALRKEADAAKKAEGREAGATGWIVKPFSPEKLLDVVKRVCG